MSAHQLPTIPDKVDGIVGWDPCVLQCRVCGTTVTQPPERGVALFIILSGFHFHRCQRREGVRMCPDCLADAIRTCPQGACKR